MITFKEFLMEADSKSTKQRTKKRTKKHSHKSGKIPANKHWSQYS